jgi:hypothetical protein
MSGLTLERFVEVQNTLSRLVDEGAVGLLSKMDVAVMAYALGIASAWARDQSLAPGDPKTPAEQKALNALHRWLHSPVGDDMLTEDAQDYHEQVEAEGGTADCERLTDEERIAWGNARRESDGNEG